MPRPETSENKGTITTKKSEFQFLGFDLEEHEMFCKMCLKFKDHLKTCKNYNHSLIGGCSNFCKNVIN